MSQENAEMVRRSVKDVHLFWSLLDEDVVLDVGHLATVDSETVYVGRDAVVTWTRHYWGTWTDYELDAEEIIDVEPSVVVAVYEKAGGAAAASRLNAGGLRYGPSRAARS